MEGLKNAITGGVTGTLLEQLEPIFVLSKDELRRERMMFGAGGRGVRCLVVVACFVDEPALGP